MCTGAQPARATAISWFERKSGPANDTEIIFYALLLCQSANSVAELEGQQRASEQVLARAPVGFRVTDERGVEQYWLMNNPLYGQLDAGAIWNRTFNEFVTRNGPKVVAGSSSTHSASIEVDA